MWQSSEGVVEDRLIFMDIYVHVVLYSKVERRSDALDLTIPFRAATKTVYYQEKFCSFLAVWLYYAFQIVSKTSRMDFSFF